MVGPDVALQGEVGRGGSGVRDRPDGVGLDRGKRDEREREEKEWREKKQRKEKKLTQNEKKLEKTFRKKKSKQKAIAFKNRYVLQNTQELVGLGVANVVGAAFSCYTTTGSFGRSAIMDNVGAKTQVAGWVGALLVMFVLLFLTPLLQSTPLNAPAAILTSVFLGLLQFGEWWFLWKTNKLDFLVFSAGVVRLKKKRRKKIDEKNSNVFFYQLPIFLSPSLPLSLSPSLPLSPSNV